MGQNTLFRKNLIPVSTPRDGWSKLKKTHYYNGPWGYIVVQLAGEEHTPITDRLLGTAVYSW